MDDAKFVCSLLLLSFALLPGTLRASEVEYISPTRQHELEQQFATSQVPHEADQTALHGKWSCDMYGMRTHLQVQRDLNLYTWTQDSLTSDTRVHHNSGAQLVHDYQWKEQAWIGVEDRFEDQVKRTADGHLISQLSVLRPRKMVVAYSVCKEDSRALDR